MFDALTEKLSKTISRLRDTGRLNDELLESLLRELRRVLLDADVSLPVVKSLTEKIRVAVRQKRLAQKMNPGSLLAKEIRDNLAALIGNKRVALNTNVLSPAVILLVGPQGSGKTTACAKIAMHFKNRHKKLVAVTSCDKRRPAAVRQLQVLAKQADARFINPEPFETATDVARETFAAAREQLVDVLLMDTAGHPHVGDREAAELSSIVEHVKPSEVLFVMDSMMGQGAVSEVQNFSRHLKLTGIVLTKADGDAQGGAALSVKEVTGTPIKLVSNGEKLEDMEVFYPDRIASRVLGMGDMKGFMDQVNRQLMPTKPRDLKKAASRQQLNFNDLRKQFEAVRKQSSLGALLSHLPQTGRGNVNKAQLASAEKDMRVFSAAIDSMTPLERRKPELLKASRKRRIAAGSGTQLQDLNRLIAQLAQVRKMMSKPRSAQFGKMFRGF